MPIKPTDKITIKEKNLVLSSLVNKVNQSNQATIITLENEQKAVLLSLEEWESIQETLYLVSIPGVKEDLIKGKNTDWEDCVPLDELKW
jgi:prevent-host-death family protein